MEETHWRVDELVAHAVDAQIAEQRAWRESIDDLSRRVAALETALAAAAADLHQQIGELARLMVAEPGATGRDDRDDGERRVIDLDLPYAELDGDEHQRRGPFRRH